jgi:copper chaperone
VLIQAVIIPPSGILVTVGDGANELAEIIYTVPEMSCGHCEAAVSSELRGVPGVEAVDVDLHAKLVTVGGANLDDAALRAAIEEAGYVAT